MTMTSPEFHEAPQVEPADVSAEISAMLDIPDDPERRPARPHEVTPEVTDFLNVVEEVVFGEDKKSLFDDHEEQLNKIRADIAAVHDEVEELDPEVAATQERLEAHVKAAQSRKIAGVARAVKPKDTFGPPVKVNSKYL